MTDFVQDDLFDYNDCGGNQILTLTDANGDVVTLKFVDFDDTLIVQVRTAATPDIYDPPAGGAKDAPATATTAAGNDHVSGVGQPEWDRPCREPGQRGGIRRRSVLCRDLEHYQQRRRCTAYQ